tara:strand:- start:1632 stop:2540 length:909 start_codon:yes stop_codon:yes gene_type:complete
MSRRDLTSLNSLVHAARYMDANDTNQKNSVIEQIIAEAAAKKKEKVNAEKVATARAIIKTISDRIIKQEKEKETMKQNELIKSLHEQEKITLRDIKMAEAERNLQNEGINRMDDIISEAYKFKLNISIIQKATAETMKRLTNILPPNQLAYAREKLNSLEQEKIMALSSKFEELWKSHITDQRNTEAREDANAKKAATKAEAEADTKYKRMMVSRLPNKRKPYKARLSINGRAMFPRNFATPEEAIEAVKVMRTNEMLKKRTMQSGGKKKLYKTHKAKKLKKTQKNKKRKNKKRKNKTKKFY